MNKYELSSLEREVFEEMVNCNPGTTLDMIFRTCIHSDDSLKFHYYANANRPPLVDISPLVRLRLDTIALYHCNVRDISPLTQIPTLQCITLDGGTDILSCDLTSLQNLCSLHLHITPHCTIPILKGLPGLHFISVSETDSLEGLRGLHSLKHLDIGYNPALSDLSPLSSCPNLEELSAYGTLVSDLTPLAGHPSLRSITLSSTKVTDISPLATIPTLELIWLYETAVEDVSCLASLPRLNSLNLYKTQVTDLSSFQGREKILGIERKKLGIKNVGKSAEEIKKVIEEIREKLNKLNITPRPPLKRDAIDTFQEQTGIKLPKEYTAFLTKIGDGFEIKFDHFFYRFPPLAEIPYDSECVKKRFSHREVWCWEEDPNATNQKIANATRNGQIELIDCGCGRSFRLIVCGGAKGEVWDMADVGIAPYGNGLDFLDWMKDFLDGKVIS